MTAAGLWEESTEQFTDVFQHADERFHKGLSCSELQQELKFNLGEVKPLASCLLRDTNPDLDNSILASSGQFSLQLLDFGVSLGKTKFPLL